MQFNFRVFRYVWEKRRRNGIGKGVLIQLSGLFSFFEYKFEKNKTKCSYLLNQRMVVTWVFIILYYSLCDGNISTLK